MIARPRSTRTTLTAIAAFGALLAGFGAVAEPVQAEPGSPEAPPNDAVVLSAPGRALAQSAADQGVDLQTAVVQELDRHGETDFWVVMGDRADLSHAYEIDDWDKRGRFVYERLTATARASQALVTAGLATSGVEFESFWISNSILVRGGDQSALAGVLGHPGVAEILADQVVKLPEPIVGQDEASVTAVAWGIANIRADEVWSQFDVRGEGIVVGNIDTGVDYTHPALVRQYRGNTGGGSFNHDYDWWDPSQVCPPAEPCDNNNHGTHTMGTMVGDDGAGNQIGVAPGAEWIAAKGCESRSCSQAALLSSGQFMLAPTKLDGQAPRPDLRPHVVNNSWGGSGGRDWYDDTVAAWVAAGMFPVFSNGNSGPGCDTAGSPADGPGAYAVGAHDSDNQIAGFSSRGPGREEEIRPDIAAPGVRVRSSVPGGYGLGSGTSMAAPHLAGAVALMWSASDVAGDVAATREALDASAVDTEDLTCGGTSENNNVYGQGRLDALEATIEVAIDSGVTGVVTDADSGQPLAGVTVSGDGIRERATDNEGRYTVRTAPGSYTLEFSRFGYVTRPVAGIVVTEETFTTVDVELEPAPSGSIAGTVTDGASGHTVPGVRVEVLDVPVDLNATTDADGHYEIPGVPAATYQVVATSSRPGQWQQPEAVQVTVTGGSQTSGDVSLPPTQDVERVSVSSDGALSNGRTTNGNDISADGRYVAFFAEGSTNLVDHPVTTQYAVYVRDRLTGATELVSVSSDGEPANGDSWKPSISGDGRYVAFFSTADNLVDDPPFPRRGFGIRAGVYVRDRVTGATELVSAGLPGESNNADGPWLSPDGRHVTFGSGHVQWVDPSETQDPPHPVCDPRPLLPGRSQLCPEGYLHDRHSGQTERSSGNIEISAGRGQVSPDGRYITFGSSDENLSDEDPPGGDIFVRDRHTETIEWVPLRGAGGTTSSAQFSDDLQLVAFGRGSGLAGALYDRTTDETTELAVPAEGAAFNFGGLAPIISGDGSSVAFDQFSLTAAFEPIPEAMGLFTLDVNTGDIERLIEGWDPFAQDLSGPQAASQDGQFVVVSTDQADLVPGPTNGVQHLYVVDRDFDPDAPQARFAVWGLAVAPRDPMPGQPVTVTANVKNVGDAGGAYEAVPLVDGVAEPAAAQTVTLEPGASTQVTVSVTRETGGDHRIRIGQASGEFRVQSGSLTGTVTDANDSAPVEGATVTAVNGDTTRSATTFAGGAYELVDLQLGTWTVTVEAENYVTQTDQVTVTEDGQELTRDIALPTGVAAAQPAEIQITLPAGSHQTADLTLANSGTAELAWEAFAWAATPQENPRILLFSDDPGHRGPDSYTDRALRRLGLDYTGTYGTTTCTLFDHPEREPDEFRAALADGPWDLIIVSHECNLYWISHETMGALRTHVANGGALIMHSWQAGVGDVPGSGREDPLWASLGVRPVNRIGYVPPSGFVYWWQPEHPQLTTPLPIPEFFDPPGLSFRANIPGNANRAEPLDQTTAVAGYTTVKQAEMAALIVGNEGRTLYRGFGDSRNSADLNANGVPDGEELWVNQIVHIGGLAARPWLEITDSGTLPPDGSTDVTLSIDATNLEPGTYTGTVELVTDAGREPRVSVPVELTVLGCDRTVTGAHLGPLTVSEGVTCLAEDARVIGPVRVLPGAGLVATGATVTGPVSATGATVVELRETLVIGPVTVGQATGRVAVAGNRMLGPVRLVDNTTGQTPIVVSGNRIVGPLVCTGNQPPPVDSGAPNQVRGPKTGQCADL